MEVYTYAIQNPSNYVNSEYIYLLREKRCAKEDSLPGSVPLGPSASRNGIMITTDT